jgi:hypothetical protein
MKNIITLLFLGFDHFFIREDREGHEGRMKVQDLPAVVIKSVGDQCISPT